MKHISHFIKLYAATILAVIFTAAAPALTGCHGSANQTSYRVAGATITTVDAAVTAWSDYYVNKKHSNPSPGDLEKLEQQDKQVERAFATYQAAVSTVRRVKAAVDTAPDAYNAAMAALDASRVDIMRLITSLIPVKK